MAHRAGGGWLASSLAPPPQPVDYPSSCGSLISRVLLSVSWPDLEGPALSASESAFSGVSMNVLCFMMPVMKLFTLLGASSVPSVVSSVLPKNFLMSLSFHVVRVPDFKFFRR